jgi:hypothetical protein
LDYLSPEKKLLIDTTHPQLTIREQAELLGIARSTIYYAPRANPADLILMNEIDQIYTKYPFYGKRRLCHALRRLGYDIGAKHTCSCDETYENTGHIPQTQDQYSQQGAQGVSLLTP